MKFVEVLKGGQTITENSILAIVPARAGSKGLPGKNIMDCAGKPLIAWTLQAAQQSSYIDRVLVSTDSCDIADIAQKYDAWVPYLRDQELARDDSSIVDVVRDALNHVNSLGLSYDYVALLQPTSPLRETQHINSAFETLLSNSKEGSETLISVKRMDEKMHWLMATDPGNGYLYSLSGLDMTNPRRQELPLCFIPNGAIYLARCKNFDGFYGSQTFPYIMDEESSLDIDYEEDLSKAIEILKKR